MQPWTSKYYPKSSREIIGQNQAIMQLLNYLKNFKKGTAAFLYGPTGNGKTSSVYAIANELNYEVIEINASETRNADSIKEKVGNALAQGSLFGQKKIILIDEIDGVSGNEDRGGINEIAKLIDKTNFPIILTANDPFDTKFSTLRNKSIMIEYHPLSYISVLNVLKKIALSEKIEFKEEDLAILARRSGGDLRGAIIDLQSLTDNTKKLKKEDIDELGNRRQKESIVNAIMRILKTTDPYIAKNALENIDEEQDELFLWLDENIPLEYKKKDDLANAYNNLSKADVFRGRINRWQYWRFLVYINDLLSAGIALAKSEKYQGFNKYTRPSRILNIWRYNQKNAKKISIAEKIAKKTHTSKKRVLKEVLPYFYILFKHGQTDKLAKYFDFDEEEIKFLKS